MSATVARSVARVGSPALEVDVEAPGPAAVAVAVAPPCDIGCVRRVAAAAAICRNTSSGVSASSA